MGAHAHHGHGGHHGHHHDHSHAPSPEDAASMRPRLLIAFSLAVGYCVGAGDWFVGHRKSCVAD